MPPVALQYAALFTAVGFEVAGTMLLAATEQFSRLLPTAAMAVCYIISFYFLTLALKTIPLAIVYASWSGLGVFAIAVLSYFIYGQALKWQAIVGLALIVNGVILVNAFSTSVK